VSRRPQFVVIVVATNANLLFPYFVYSIRSLKRRPGEAPPVAVEGGSRGPYKRQSRNS
jgi:hypothetical protein